MKVGVEVIHSARFGYAVLVTEPSGWYKESPWYKTKEQAYEVASEQAYEVGIDDDQIEWSGLG